MPRVAFVTCQVLPEADVDEALLLETCQAHGLDAECVAWDDPTANWSQYNLAIVRSSWNYYAFEAQFRRWIESTSQVTDLWNPTSVMLRTIHKSYLLELEQSGIPIVPTRFVYKSNPQPLHQIVRESGWNRFVLKPAVSASSFMTRPFFASEMEEAEAFLTEILAKGDAMVQQYVPSVSEGGEAAIVVIDGEITHAVVKNPRYHEGEESVSPGFAPAPEQRELAQRVIDSVEEPLLYGRIDLMRLDEGNWVLSEAEFIEPSLYFIQHPPAVERFVRAVKTLVSDAP